MDTLTKLSRLAAIFALRAVGLFSVGVVLGFVGFTASTMGSQSHLSAPQPSVQHPNSGASVESKQTPNSPHFVASSAGAFQVRFH
jgi:hypothetical protein